MREVGAEIQVSYSQRCLQEADAICVPLSGSVLSGRPGPRGPSSAGVSGDGTRGSPEG